MMGFAVLQLFLFICVQVTIAESNTVTIKDGASLKKYLCGNGLPPNTQLLLDEPELRITEEESEFCLLENITNISITASERVLEIGHWYVNVSCAGSDKETFGFGFFNVTNLTIRSVLFVNCSARITPEAVKYVNESSQFVHYSDALLVPLFFSHCNNLKLHNVFVDTKGTDKFSMGLVGVNVCGKSSVTQSYNSSAAAFAVTKKISYPLPSVFFHFTDSNYTSTECNLSISANSISARGSRSNMDFFQVGPKTMPVLSNYSDLALFMTQSFSVNMEMNFANSTGNENSVHIIVGYINSMKNSSFVTLQGPSYQHCFNSMSTEKPLPIMFAVVFYENTQSLDSSKIGTGVSNAMLIRNTSFSNINYVPSENGGMLHIMQYTRTLSYQVTLENVSWCGNVLPQDLTMYAFSPLLVQDILQPEKDSNLHITLSNLFVIKNLNVYGYYNISAKSSACLLCFENIENITMTGANYLAENSGGSVISVTSSNLFISGHLTIGNGHAFEGGGIRLDSMSTLFLKEPLEAKFINNIADHGSAIYAPIRADGVSSIQVVPREKILLDNVSSMNLTLNFTSNSNGQFAISFYAPHFSIFGRQTSSNLLFKGPQHDFSFESDSWDSKNMQFAYTTLIDAILVMEESDKYASLANGLCLWQKNWQNCMYMDQNIVNSTSMNRPPLSLICLPEVTGPQNKLINAYAGQNAFSVRYVDHQEYGACCNGEYVNPFHNLNSSLYRDNSTLRFTISSIESGTCAISLSDVEANIFSIPILQVDVIPCPIGFRYGDNKTCVCYPELEKHNYYCNIDIPSIVSPNEYWTSFESTKTYEIHFSSHCPPNFCNKLSREIHLYQDPALSCLGSRTGDLCGECQDNHSMVFGSDDCHDHCTNWYLFTILVYAMAGVLLVLLLFALRLTVATGTINGLIFYANVLGLVMDRLTKNISSHYVAFVRVWISLFNYEFGGFPLCFYEGMTTAAKVGLQFIFPTYLWGIIVVLIVLSKFSSRVSKFISNSSVQVLTTLFFLSFSKLLRTIIIIFSHSTIYSIAEDNSDVTSKMHVWFYSGKEYGGTSKHIILLVLAAAYTLLFLLPYALLVTFSSCFVRFRVVNKFRPFIEAYGGPYKDKWRFWFGLRLWITILLFGLDGALEGTNSNTMFIVQSFVIMVFLLVQVFIRPFKNSLIGLLDASFMFNYWLLVEMHLYSVTRNVFAGTYIFLTVAAALVTCLILLLHMCALKYPDTVADIIGRRERKGYEVINEGGNEPGSDEDLFQAAEERVVDTY